MSDLREFLAALPKKSLVLMLYDLVMDTVEREHKELTAKGGVGDLTHEQLKAVVMRRLNERLGRTLGKKGGSNA